MKNQKKSIGIALMTYKAKGHLPFCLPPLLACPLKPKILVVNSSSQDGTVELAQQMGAEILVIPRAEFNHGTARDKAREFLNTDIVVFMTQDAYSMNSHLIEALVDPILSGKASIAYARQVPHDGAKFFESFPRNFNYPATGHIRSIGDMDRYGVYTYFCSNTCAAYLNSALDEIGGFQKTLFGEDTIATAKLIKKGHKVAYVAEAVVKHSHHYTLKQEFCRHFDIGLARKEHKSLLSAIHSDGSRGKQYVHQLFHSLIRNRHLFLLPYAFLHIASKWAGYQMGQICYKAPNAIKRLLSSQDFFWMAKNK